MGIEEVANAAEAVKAAQATLIDAVRKAREKGGEIAAIAESAGVSQVVIHKWLGDSADEYIDVLQALNEGLQVIANRGTQQGAYHALKAISAPHTAMVSRLKTVTIYAESIRRDDLPADDLEALTQALYAAGECQRYFNERKKYPNKVRALRRQ